MAQINGLHTIWATYGNVVIFAQNLHPSIPPFLPTYLLTDRPTTDLLTYLYLPTYSKYLTYSTYLPIPTISESFLCSMAFFKESCSTEAIRTKGTDSSIIAITQTSP